MFIKLFITQNIDNFIKHDFTMGLEIYNGNIAYQTALIGAEKNSEVVANLLNTYHNESLNNLNNTIKTYISSY